MAPVSIPGRGNLATFCLHSLLREYGWLFFRRIGLRHPLRTARAMRAAGALDDSGDALDVPAAGPARPFGGPGALVGAPCRACAIREFGRLALRAGAAFYVMTSAKDILLDVFAPAVNAGVFRAGLFALCRYSFKPFAPGLLAGGVQAQLWPFETGDCRDYPTWLRADRGDKPDRTEIAPANRQTLRDVLRAAAQAAPPARFQKRGHVLFPLPS